MLSRQANIQGHSIASLKLFSIHHFQSSAAVADLFSDKINARPCYKLIWIREGSCSFRIDMTRYGATSNCLVFITPEELFLLETNTDIQGFALCFSESFLSESQSNPSESANLFRQFSALHVLCLQENMQNDLGELMERMVKEFASDTVFRDDILKKYFKILWLYMVRQYEHELEPVNMSRNIDLVQRFMNLVEKHFISNKMVADYASLLFLTPNYLNQIVKKVTNYSAGYHIRQRIMLEAKRNATCSDKTMKEIAYQLGFTDPAHFSKFFKKTTGTNFVTFRREKLRYHFIQE